MDKQMEKIVQRITAFLRKFGLRENDGIYLIESVDANRNFGLEKVSRERKKNKKEEKLKTLNDYLGTNYQEVFLILTYNRISTTVGMYDNGDLEFIEQGKLIKLKNRKVPQLSANKKIKRVKTILLYRIGDIYINEKTDAFLALTVDKENKVYVVMGRGANSNFLIAKEPELDFIPPINVSDSYRKMNQYYMMNDPTQSNENTNSQASNINQENSGAEEWKEEAEEKVPIVSENYIEEEQNKPAKTAEDDVETQPIYDITLDGMSEEENTETQQEEENDSEIAEIIESNDETDEDEDEVAEEETGEADSIIVEEETEEKPAEIDEEENTESQPLEEITIYGIDEEENLEIQPEEENDSETTEIIEINDETEDEDEDEVTEETGEEDSIIVEEETEEEPAEIDEEENAEIQPIEEITIDGIDEEETTETQPIEGIAIDKMDEEENAEIQSIEEITIDGIDEEENTESQPIEDITIDGMDEEENVETQPEEGNNLEVTEIIEKEEEESSEERPIIIEEEIREEQEKQKEQEEIEQEEEQQKEQQKEQKELEVTEVESQQIQTDINEETNENVAHEALLLEKRKIHKDPRALELRVLKNKKGNNLSSLKYNKRMEEEINTSAEDYVQIPKAFIEEVEKYISSTTFKGQKNKLIESAFIIYRNYEKQGVLSAIDEAAHRLQPVIQKIS